MYRSFAALRTTALIVICVPAIPSIAYLVPSTLYQPAPRRSDVVECPSDAYWPRLDLAERLDALLQRLALGLRAKLLEDRDRLARVVQRQGALPAPQVHVHTVA